MAHYMALCMFHADSVHQENYKKKQPDNINALNNPCIVTNNKAVTGTMANKI